MNTICSTRLAARCARSRQGLTLAELLVAATIMLMIATAVASLAATVNATNSYCQGHTVAAQHARVVLSRIENAVEGAAASEQFPGCLVVTEQAGSAQLPSTLVVWKPATATAANPTGLPLVSELVIFSPDPTSPGRLLEIRAPDETGVCPATGDTAAWRTLTARLTTSQTTNKIVLTDRLRTAPLTGSWTSALTPADLRGVIRFRCLVAPTQQEFALYRSGLKTWQSLAWPLDSFRATSGTRAVACQTEIQIAPGNMESAALTALPFYGSTLITYELAR
jgi:hypothetical protein